MPMMGPRAVSVTEQRLTGIDAFADRARTCPGSRERPRRGGAHGRAKAHAGAGSHALGPRPCPCQGCARTGEPCPWLTGRTLGQQGAPPVLRVRSTGIRGRSSRRPPLPRALQPWSHARGGPTWSVGARRGRPAEHAPHWLLRRGVLAGARPAALEPWSASFARGRQGSGSPPKQESWLTRPVAARRQGIRPC